MTVESHIHDRPASAPVFTHGSTLAWLGHDCPQRCSAPPDDLGASISFATAGDWLPPNPDRTVIAVELAAHGQADRRPIDNLPRLSENHGPNPVADTLTVGGAGRTGEGPHLPRSTTVQSRTTDQRSRWSGPSTNSSPGAVAVFGVAEGPTCALSLFGEFDLAGLEVWNVCVARLLARQGGDVTIDLAGLRFIDAAGMGGLVRLANELTENRHTMTLRAPLGNVRRAFTAAGLAHLMRT